ncbi:hypothetical protein BCR35DRAFT_300114 [Leucosporidium creatinivorum]|uniref:Uncharacterized protein n=1 Tax=Leucosporidium creatinivorum TaxID=106004 RepID=A0A1Y2G140_9BASI|nr:hypothetical protein BCR35DRAFT_300114 [Leucosporidium creatinivorum]
MSAPISQTTSNQTGAAEHHTPHSTNSVPSTTNAGPTSTTSGAGGATPSAASHTTSSTGQHNTSSSAGGNSDAAAGLGSDPWEGKERPSEAAQHPDHANGGAGEDGVAEGAGHEVGEDGLPVQSHAGKVGLGPNYKKHPNTADKVGGTLEEIKGKILHKPEVAQHGADRKTGALEEKKKVEDDNADPFKKEEDSPAGTKEASKDAAATAGTKSSDPTSGSTPNPTAGHPTTSTTPSHTASRTDSTTSGATPAAAESTCA